MNAVFGIELGGQRCQLICICQVACHLADVTTQLLESIAKAAGLIVC